MEQRRYTRTLRFRAVNGRSYFYITCPFCKAVVKAYAWSLAGSGKKCTCGALHGSLGYTIIKDNQINSNMRKIKVGDRLKAIFTQVLPGNDVAPPLKHGIEYECKQVHTDRQGNDHIDVGLVRNVNFVTSYATGEQLPGTAHWCHPNRFIIVNPINA